MFLVHSSYVLLKLSETASSHGHSASEEGVEGDDDDDDEDDMFERDDIDLYDEKVRTDIKPDTELLPCSAHSQ